MQNQNYSITNWRELIRKNDKKTKIVIAIYFLIYLALGVLIDLAFYSYVYPYAPYSQIFNALITFKLFPKITFILFLVSLVSLWITFLFHDRLMLLGTEYREINLETAQTLEEKQLYHVVEEMKVAAGLSYMPRVFIIEASYMNAFASGYSEKSAMVCITRGLMNKLERSEMQAVMAHELSHVRHNDIKVTLMASVLSNLILMIIDFFFYNMVFNRDRNNRDNNNLLFLVIIILRYLLPIITVLLSLYLSRTREYMADAGCVELMRDNQPLARALIKIHQDHQNNLSSYQQEYGATAHEDVRRAAYLYDPVSSGAEPVKSISSLFSTHPSLEERLKALGITVK